MPGLTVHQRLNAKPVVRVVESTTGQSAIVTVTPVRVTHPNGVREDVWVASGDGRLWDDPEEAAAFAVEQALDNLANG